MRPAVFELLYAPQLGKRVGLRAHFLAMLPDCGVNIEQGAISIEDIGADRHEGFLEFASVDGAV
jgi:hypothetical protein